MKEDIYNYLSTGMFRGTPHVKCAVSLVVRLLKKNIKVHDLFLSKVMPCHLCVE